MRFGAHVSIANGLVAAVDYALSVGCECAQIFAKSPRQWQGPPTDPRIAAQFAQHAAENDLPVFSHTAYLINLASDDPVLWERSVHALADELARGRLLGVSGVVSHVGASRGADRAAAVARVSEAVLEAFARAGTAGIGARLLLENTAGAGGSLGGSFQELAAIIAKSGLPPERLGICLDTCHAFAFGYALDTQAGWADALASVDATVGLERLGLVHANDCKFERGSHRDRHEWIGDGFLGMRGFEAMVCSAPLTDVCAITELPGEVPYKDAENLRRLARIRSECA